MASWRDRISVDPTICHGTPCVRGTRIPVSVVLDNLGAGVGEAELLGHYPSLSSDDIRAVLQYAAEMMRQRFVELPAGMS